MEEKKDGERKNEGWNEGQEGGSQCSGPSGTCGEMTQTENSLVLLILLLLFLPHLYALGFQNMMLLSMCVCVRVCMTNKAV
jgi:hypothetical protein